MIKVVIADDHSIIRTGLKKILKDESDMQVSGEAANYKEVMTQLSQQIPDVLLLDITMPGRDGLEILAEVREQYPAINVLMLSMHPEERYAMRTLKAGAKGYVSKDSANDELVGAIRKVYTGRKYLSKPLAEKMVEYIDDERDKPAHEMLSNREFQVMCRIAKGQSLEEIAKELVLSPNTIATYRERVLAKLELKSNVELTTYAHRNGIID